MSKMGFVLEMVALWHEMRDNLDLGIKCLHLIRKCLNRHEMLIIYKGFAYHKGVLSMKCCFRHEMLVQVDNRSHERLTLGKLMYQAQHLLAPITYLCPAEYHAMPKRSCNERN